MHEAYLRLVGSGPVQWDSSGHFFAAAAEAMRRVLLDRARRKKAEKHGGEWARVELSERDPITCTTPGQLVAIDDVLDPLAVLRNGSAFQRRRHSRKARSRRL